MTGCVVRDLEDIFIMPAAKSSCMKRRKALAVMVWYLPKLRDRL
jgi:hypothetical protein